MTIDTNDKGTTDLFGSEPPRVNGLRVANISLDGKTGNMKILIAGVTNCADTAALGEAWRLAIAEHMLSLHAYSVTSCMLSVHRAQKRIEDLTSGKEEIPELSRYNAPYIDNLVMPDPKVKGSVVYMNCVAKSSVIDSASFTPSVWSEAFAQWLLFLCEFSQVKVEEYLAQAKIEFKEINKSKYNVVELKKRA